MNLKNKNILLLALVLVHLPSNAYANAGTPLIWGGIFHLAIGNLFIGLAEGMILSCLCKESKCKCIACMILANYCSAWIGGLGLAFLSEYYIPWSIYNVKSLFLALVFACWLLTVLLECPCVWLVMRKQEYAVRRSWKYSLLIQTTSYIILIGWYLLCGCYSLLTQCDMVAVNDIPLQEKVCLYYISSENDNVYSLRPGQESVYVDKLEISGDDSQWLICIPSSSDSELASLGYVVHGIGSTNVLNNRVLIKELARKENVIIDYPDKDSHAEYYRDPNWLWNCRCLGNAKNSDVHFKHGFWPREGISLLSKNPHPIRAIPCDSSSQQPDDVDVFGYQRGEWASVRRLFALETPFLGWNVGNIIQLPDDVCILQLGRDQLCLFDYRTMKLALLARGYGAIAVLE